jgi:hypothetical protein
MVLKTGQVLQCHAPFGKIRGNFRVKKKGIEYEFFIS